MKRRREIEETAQYLGSLEGEDGLRSAMSAPPNISIETTALLSLRRQLARAVSPDLSEEGRERVLGTLMTAIAQQSHERTPSLFERIIATFVTKATALTAAGLLLAGSAMSASAAFGGPNLPAQALSAVGLSANSHQAARATLGINNAPAAAQTGVAQANGRASDGAGNASTGGGTGHGSTGAAGAVTPEAGQGINNAPSAADAGKSHANEHAFNGSGNATVPAAASEGINNAPAAAVTGAGHANPHASNGAGNAVEAGSPATVPTTAALPIQASPNASKGAGNAPEGIGNAPAAAQASTDHPAPEASAGSGNAPISVPTPPATSGLGGQAPTQHGR